MNFGLGVAPPEAYIQITPGKNNCTWEKITPGKNLPQGSVAVGNGGICVLLANALCIVYFCCVRFIFSVLNQEIS